MSARTAIVASLTAGLILAVAARADGGVLAGDSNAMPFPYRNSVNFDSNFMGNTVDANLHFAVYEPGQFNVSFPGQDPSGDSDYVYTYQIVENMGDDIVSLTVGLDGPDDPEPLGAIDFLPGTGLHPSDSYYSQPDSEPPTSAVWEFFERLTGDNDPSAILIFTSGAPPELNQATVSVGTWAAKRVDIPSPTPEPASLALMAAGLAAICCRRRTGKRY